MKRYLALILSLWVGTVQAQMTLACQFRGEANGYQWRHGQWEPTLLQPSKPFFLTVLPNNSLEPRSALAAMGTNPVGINIADRVTCFPYNNFPMTQHSSCAGFAGNHIILSLQTLEGAISKLFGSAMNGSTYRDSISVAPFVCQKM